MSPFNQGRVVSLKRWTERLFSLRVDAQVEPFRAGQFGRLALPLADGSLLARPYSFVNPPAERPLEFYFITLDGGPLSGRLADLAPGEPVWIAPRPAGLMTLDDCPASRHLWLLSTGTGVGPFLSIARDGLTWERFERVVLVHAVRLGEELGYRDEIAAIGRRHGARFVHQPFVSREAFPGALSGRVPAALRDGRLEAAVGLAISAADSQVMICGNPDMVRDTEAALVERGLARNKRKEPGQISIEAYW